MILDDGTSTRANKINEIDFSDGDSPTINHKTRCHLRIATFHRLIQCMQKVSEQDIRYS